MYKPAQLLPTSFLLKRIVASWAPPFGFMGLFPQCLKPYTNLVKCRNCNNSEIQPQLRWRKANHQHTASCSEGKVGPGSPMQVLTMGSLVCPHTSDKTYFLESQLKDPHTLNTELYLPEKETALSHPCWDSNQRLCVCQYRYLGHDVVSYYSLSNAILK